MSQKFRFVAGQCDVPRYATPGVLVGKEQPSLGELAPSVRFIANSWPRLPPHIQESILTLVSAVVAQGHRISSQ